MKVFEKPQGFSLDILEAFPALQSRLQQLLPQRIQPQLFFQKPAQLGTREGYPFTLQLSGQEAKSRHKVSWPLARLPAELCVEEHSQLSLLIQSTLAVDALERLQQLVQACKGVLLGHDNLYAVGILCTDLLLILKLGRGELPRAVAQRPIAVTATSLLS